MKSMLFMILFFLSSTVFASGGYEGYSASLSLYYATTSIDNNGTTSDTKYMPYDLRFGYAMTGGWYLGGIYANEGYDEVDTTTKTSIGASFGYVSNGWLFIGHYFLKSDYEISSTTTYKEGSGVGFDVGHMWQVGTWSLGPQVSYKSLSYKKRDISGVESSYDYSVSKVQPYFTFAVNF